MGEAEVLDTLLVVVSDRAAAGTRPDATAALLRPALAAAGFALCEVVVVPDERPAIAQAIRAGAARAALVLTTGGTGVAPRDVTPEATRDVLEAEVPGLGEEMRRQSVARQPKALGSRALGGVLGRSVVLNLPGRPEGALECFGYVAGVLRHLCALRRGPVSDASHLPPGA
ncbi:MAG: molybdenum cofactor synthesis domain-containing protein [Planctomycetia bacterium]